MPLPSPFDEPKNAPGKAGAHWETTNPAAKSQTPNSPPKQVSVSPLQYSLSSLLALTLVVSVAFAPAYYFMKARTDATMQMPAILLTIAAPLLLVVFLRFFLTVQEWFGRR